MVQRYEQKPSTNNFSSSYAMQPISPLGYTGMFQQYGRTGVASGQASANITNLEKEREQRVKGREQEGRGILDQIIKMYQPGGAYGQGTASMLEQQKTKDVASATQGLVSSGLYNTTQQAGLGKKWEEEVGMPTRAKLEDIRYGALSSALGKKVDFLTGIEDELMNYSLLAQLTQTAYGGQA